MEPTSNSYSSEYDKPSDGKVGDYFIAAAILLRSLTVYTSSSFFYYVDFIVFILLSLAVIPAIFSATRKAQTNTHIIYNCFVSFLVPFVALMLIYLSTNTYAIRKFFCFLVIVPLTTIYFSAKGPKYITETFTPRLVNTYLWVVSPGFVLWILQLLGFIQPNMSLQISWGYDTPWPVQGIYGLVFNRQPAELPIASATSIYRFTSIFVEGPVFVGLTLIILACALYWCRTAWWKIVLISCFGLCSLTTTGFVLIPLLLLSTLFFKIAASKSSSKVGEERIVVSVFFMAIILFIAALILPPLLKTKLQTTSGNTHLNDFAAGLQAFIDSPIFGHGIGNYADLAEYTSAYKSVFSPTSTLMAVSAQGGLILLIAYLFPLLLLLRTGVQNGRNFIVIFTILLIFSLCIVEDAALLFLFQAFGYSTLTTLKTIPTPISYITTKNMSPRLQQINS
jgi:hypothetical protein